MINSIHLILSSFSSVGIICSELCLHFSFFPHPFLSLSLCCVRSLCATLFLRQHRIKVMNRKGYLRACKLETYMLLRGWTYVCPRVHKPLWTQSPFPLYRLTPHSDQMSGVHKCGRKIKAPIWSVVIPFPVDFIYSTCALSRAQRLRGATNKRMWKQSWEVAVGDVPIRFFATCTGRY